MDAALREFVRQRADGRCEYCRALQEYSELRFHIEHVIPRQHGGGDDAWNLALACPECNLHKGPNLTAVDSDTNAIVNLFHPRRDRWDDHFAFRGSMIDGKTPVGRATSRLLDMNDADRIRIREALG